MACLFNERGDLYDWFVPSDNPNDQRVLDALNRNKWVLRLASNRTDQFTLVLKTANLTVTGKRISSTSNDLGHYAFEDEKGAFEYPTLVDLLLDKLPGLVRESFPRENVTIPNKLDYWRRMEREGFDPEMVAEVGCLYSFSSNGSLAEEEVQTEAIVYRPIEEDTVLPQSTPEEELEKLRNRVNNIETSVGRILEVLEAFVQLQDPNNF
eukprot:TRINITY_DN10963_c0_g1_i1.p1 TRINITY_DN10963_c0_g1~~TRINITY_DN10963_c0_g1_i1.p1  ORF type:complete len:209 (+),score=62.44 TRINITY_DN10963_c0_g1_i1:591-1217(+)